MSRNKFYEDKFGFGVTYRDLNGNVISRTPQTHPYSYEPYVTYMSGYKKGVGHITTGQKNIEDYLRRVKKNIYTPEHLLITLYDGDFFEIWDHDPNDRPTIKSTSIDT